MDNIAEQLVAKQPTSADTVKKVLISVAALLIASLLMFFAIAMAVFALVIPAVGVLAGAVYLISTMNVEYEYIVTNNEIDIDKIIGKSRRKRLITLDISAAEAFAPYGSSDVTADATVHATDGTEKNAYNLVVKHSAYGTVNLIFNPNEKIREAIMQELPHALRIKLTHHVE